MSSLALMEIQRALYTKLNGDGVLMGMLSAIYDAPPQAAMTPYLVLGDGQSSVIPADGLSVTALQMDLTVWGEPEGRKSVLTIMNRLVALLHLGTLSLAGLQLVDMRCDEAASALEEEATQVRGRLRVNLWVMEE
jgi:hypothetical protein